MPHENEVVKKRRGARGGGNSRGRSSEHVPISWLFLLRGGRRSSVLRLLFLRSSIQTRLKCKLDIWCCDVCDNTCTHAPSVLTHTHAHTHRRAPTGSSAVKDVKRSGTKGEIRLPRKSRVRHLKRCICRIIYVLYIRESTDLKQRFWTVLKVLI